MPKCEKTKFTVAKNNSKNQKSVSNKGNGIFFRAFTF